MGVGKTANISAYCLRTADSIADSRSDPVPEPAPEVMGLFETSRSAQLDDVIRVLDAEELGEDAARVIGVIKKEDQVPETDQGVGALSRPRETLGVAMNIADHMHAHGGQPNAVAPAGRTVSRVGQQGARAHEYPGARHAWTSLREVPQCRVAHRTSDRIPYRETLTKG